MAQNIIEVENVSKRYRLGDLGSGTITHDFKNWWSSFIRKENSTYPCTEINDRNTASKNKYVWSLKDLDFSVAQGDVFGIIGKNGAGKSTLLKLISKITQPTIGRIKINGRIASLLEVGTGFHPDLSGKENIFLNGAILGMHKNEIKSKLDEIVQFSEIGKFLDTPVKRYSSGMYVRLGFAIAAHLDPEILVIDEVLAVGDFAFQQKCLGKMKEISKQGRTVLFVSHSMPAIKQLCNKAILLEHGMQQYVGDVKNALSIYQQEAKDIEAGKRMLPISLSPAYFTDWKLEGPGQQFPHICFSGDECQFSFGFTSNESFKNCEIRMMIKYENLIILHASSLDSKASFTLLPGTYRFIFNTLFPIRDAKFEVEVVMLSMGKIIDTWLSTTPLTVLDNFTSHVNAGIVKPDTNFSIVSNQLSKTPL